MCAQTLIPFRPVIAAVVGVAFALSLSSCGSGQVDVRYPTVQQMDEMDVQWGLPKRKSRGAPSRAYSYDGSSAPAGPMASGPGPVEAPVLPDPALEIPATSAAAPSIPDQLR
jgi:hypothetical protein